MGRLFRHLCSGKAIAAVSSPHSSGWLHAILIPSCDLHLSNEAVRVVFGMRLGVNICIPHFCPCGTLVDARGTHGLSCQLAFGRAARHHLLNDLVWRALSKADVPSIKEPAGLIRSNGKRPDGLILIPWLQGKPLTWDVTAVNTVADSYLLRTAVSAGGAAELAADNKYAKYVTIPSTYLFQPIAFETFRPINASAIDFLSELGRRIQQTSGDVCEGTFLFQRLSIAIQRYNAVAFRGSFSASTDSGL